MIDIAKAETELKKTESELAKSEKTLKGILEEMSLNEHPDPIAEVMLTQKLDLASKNKTELEKRKILIERLLSKNAKLDNIRWSGDEVELQTIEKEFDVAAEGKN